MHDYFSNREAEVQLVQPPHTEYTSVLDTSNVLDTSSTLHVCSRNKQNENRLSILPDHQIPLLPVELSRNIASPSPSDTETSEIISGTRLDVSEKEHTEDVSTELSNDAQKAFLNGTDSSENHNDALDQKCLLCIAGSNASQTSNTEYDVSNAEDKILSVCNSQDFAVATGEGSHQCFTAMETLVSDPAKQSPALDPSHISEVLSYKYPEKAQIFSESHAGQESVSTRVQRRPGVTEAPHDRLSERPFSTDEPMLLIKQGETACIEDATEPPNSRTGDRVLFEQCVSSTESLDMKGDTDRVVDKTLTLTRIRIQPFIDSSESLERQHTDESEEPKKMKEHILEENENASQMKRIIWSEYSEEAFVVRGSRLQEDDEELKDENTEIWISSRTSLVSDEGEPHKPTECLDRGEEDVVYYELMKNGFSDSSERQKEEYNIADGECENALKTVGQGIYGMKSEGDDYIEKELHKLYNLQSSPETCRHLPNLCITSHTNSPSGNFTCTKSLRWGELHFPASHKSFVNEKTLKNGVAQDLEDQGVGTEFPSSFSRIASPSVSKLSSWLLICSNLSSLTGAIVCAILFVIFVNAYLHELPVCLAIYLLSVCWWCRQGIKKDVTAADSVD